MHEFVGTYKNVSCWSADSCIGIVPLIDFAPKPLTSAIARQAGCMLYRAQGMAIGTEVGQRGLIMCHCTAHYGLR